MPHTHRPFAPAERPCAPAPAAADSRIALTRHARVRLQQRGIPDWFLALLVDHGRTRHDGHGALICSVDHATRRRLREHLSRSDYAAAERWFGVYAVVAHDERAVVTAAHRTRRRHLH